MNPKHRGGESSDSPRFYPDSERIGRSASAEFQESTR
jgi:hypothetical protein